MKYTYTKPTTKSRRIISASLLAGSGNSVPASHINGIGMGEGYYQYCEDLKKWYENGMQGDRPMPPF